MRTITKGYTNALEEQLYSSFESIKDNNKLSHPYERGLFFSLSNYHMHYEEFEKLYKRQYKSIIKSVMGYSLSKDDIKVVKGIPNRDIISKLCYNKIPIVVAGIHDNSVEDTYRQYQHQHLYVYNLHHYLPDNITLLEDKISQLDSYFLRYVNWNKKWKTQRDFVRITPVGYGKYLHTDIVKPTNLFDYLSDAEYGTVINYMSSNRHVPSTQYPLKTIYTTLNQL